jgi:uncharacterized lipoprotein YmbA
MINRFARIAILCAVVSLGACASTPPSRFYTLRALSTPGTTSSDVSIAVGPVTLPAAVDRPEIVVASGANELRLDEFNRWAGPLQEELCRVVAENLTTILHTPRVTQFPQTSSADADYCVAIEVRRFDSALGKAATLQAVWVVRDARGGKARTGRTEVSEPMRDNNYEALAAAHSRAAARLSQDIADFIQAPSIETGHR